MKHFHSIIRYLIILLFFLLTRISSFAQTVATPDSIKTAIEPAYDKVNKTHRLFLGESYRKLWATPVNIRVFHLNQEKGGLKILQRGGGMQSKSLRLEATDGKEWVLRSVQKYPEKVLPPTLRKSLAKDIIQDQISAEHPFAFLIVPPLAQKLGVPHSHPEIVYVPDDPAFGEHRKDFANQVFLFEEREPLDADKTDNTLKTQSRLENDNDNRVDQKTVLRARLLDFLLGDWDRHEDQWRWECVKNDNGTTYEPVPRDRDQVFYNASGVLPYLVSRHIFMAKFQNYGDHIRSINRWNLNARYFDRYFLNSLNEDDWKTEITYVQNQLTDEVITQAVKQMPATAYQMGGHELVQKLIARRNALPRQALKYYRNLSHTLEIPASNKREQIEITHQPDKQLNVTIYKLKKDGTKGQPVYNRTFKPSVTQEVRLYGMGGKDVFAVNGNKPSPILIRMIGGDDEDTFTVDSNLRDKHLLYVYDRSDEPNHLPASSQARLRISTDTTVNTFNRTGFKYNFLQPLMLANINRDYGFQFIGNFILQQQGFRKEPYANQQNLIVNYGFGTSSLLLNYIGDFKQAVGKNDLVINMLSLGPNYMSNFFGTGNNTAFVRTGDRPIRFYRNIYNYLSADVKLKRTFKNWTVSGGLGGQFYHGDGDDNQNRFLGVYDRQHPDQNVFSNQVFGGASATASLDTRDRSLLAHKGVLWNTSLTGMTGLNIKNHTYGQLASDFSFYLNPDKDSILVIANRTGAGITLGDAAYYQQFKLGGNQNLRGFYYWRFTGKSMAYNNLEVRLKVLNFNSYLLPGTLGVIGFNDVGRVWSPGESSSTWHDGYGGGIYFLPAQLFIFQAVVGFSKEGTYPYISAGFRF
ncbi:BamA/TamA family outer membrane protein [Mucilaginibacter lacusdianchii]|uniref:BamA/TamA family outer membrane protein n=1 Tax=Mucilaginibacter lacusdianchii TaxID=2684211 RepID=UPI00131D165C|nr:BamA/TamA family outer membrane protein [Mucilaginibacter sp. JXJ CY 39]